MLDLRGKHSIISIILPFKNEEKYLHACIESILSQTYDHWELILVDDNSTDNSSAIAKLMVAQDRRVRYLKNPHVGVIHALHHGFLASTGNYITRMDGDDLKTPDNLEQLLLVTAPGTIGVGQIKYFRDQGLGDGYRHYEQWLNGLIKANNNFTAVYKECVIPSPCWMAVRDDFLSAGGFDSPLYPEDYDLCFRFYKAGLKTSGTQGVIHLWRDHETRTTRTSSLYADNRFMELKLHYFKEIDYDSTKPLVLWGAGKKGKVVAKDWISANLPFVWLTDNPNKIGHNIYGIVLEDSRVALLDDEQQIVIVVADKTGQKDINLQLNQLGNTPFWFC
ncbi:MAG: glycosyltransferase involved in cell wall biosynthesis [Bacteroidia bacterium]|jgi:glycosyltransferase involved in cell wall biosynthesis